MDGMEWNGMEWNQPKSLLSSCPLSNLNLYKVEIGFKTNAGRDTFNEIPIDCAASNWFVVQLWNYDYESRGSSVGCVL